MNARCLLLALLATRLSPLLGADSVLVFNEIMYHPATNEPALEWVELRNQMAVDVDVSGWAIRGGIQFDFPSNSVVPGRGYIVVAISPSLLSALTGLTNVLGPFTGRLGNNGDGLELRNNSGWLMDEVTYGVEDDWPVAPDGSGVSLAKVDPESASAPAAHWAASAEVGGTPGRENFPRADVFVAPAGLVSFWNFEDPGTQARDLAGQNSGTLGIGVTRAGGGLVFDGTSNAFVNFGPGTAQGSFAVSTGVAIELVIQPNWDGSNTAALFARAPARPASYRDTVLASRPLAYWRLDDSTTTIRDTSTNARNGTATVGVLLNQSSLVPTDSTNAAARFGGSDRITVNGFEKIGPAGYSVEFWVKPHALPTGCCQNLVGDGEAASDYFMMNYVLGPQQGLVGALRPHFGPGNSPVSMDSPTALVVGNTYHAVTTWDARSSGANAVIYLNGVANRVGTITTNLPVAGTTGANRVYIGKDDRDTTDGNNTLDEVALYNYPLSASEVAAHFFAGTATNFDLDLGNALQLAFQNDGRNALANPPVADGPVLSFGLTVGGVYSELDMPLDGQAGRPALAALQDGRPHHLAATYDSATGLKAIYVDGLLRFSTTLTGLVNTTNAANAVAGNVAVQGATPFTGAMDNLAYWGRALSAGEVAAHAAAVQAGYDYFMPTSGVAGVRLAFNEVSASTNSDFWLELLNHGTNSVLLDGFTLFHDGATNAAFVFPATGTSLAPGGFLTLDHTTLGFHPDSGDKFYLYAPGRTNVLDGVVVKKTLRGRHPDGVGRWLRPSVATPGASNTFTFREEIVINEIMYRHALLPGTNNLPSRESPEQWIELYNRGSNVVDLTGWELDGGIRYQFAVGQTLAPGGYLVVTRNLTYLRPLYPSINLVGDFNGRLSGKSDRIVLKDAAGNPADEVRYFDGHPWPEYPDGGGSSLELRDPWADNAKPEAWAASDETRKTAWQSYSYRMVANVPSGSGQPAQWNDFILGLLGEGECLIDDLSVVESPTNNPVPFIANGDFENGLTGWRLPGNHGRSRVVTDPDNSGHRVLHVIATGPQEHMHNHIETTYIGGRTVQNGREYQIAFRARWLAGNPLLNTRLYFNRVARTTALPMPALNGTPGARNSRFEANIGPTFSQLQHRPMVPQPGEPVTVSVTAGDPQGVGGCAVWWSANSGAWSSAPMSLQPGGGYSGALPGYPAGTIVQFYVRAADGLGAASTCPAAGADSGALYMVEDAQANLSLAHNVRIILSPTNRALLHAFTNVMSNHSLPCTVIYDEQRAYYDLGVRLKGSQRGRYSDTRVGFRLEFRRDDPFRGVHPVMLVDRSGAGDNPNNRQAEIMIRHMLLRAGNIPGTYPDLCRVIAPFSTHTGSAILSPRHEDEFIENAFANGGEGPQWELELIYYPTSTNAAGYKNPQPDQVVGTDISDLGNDKEIYRYNFILKNHRDADNYAPFMGFAKTFSLTGSALDQATRGVMDVEEWLRVWALVTLCAVGDSYTFGNNHNLLMYLRPADNRMLAFPVDMDFTFTRGATSALIGDQNFSKIINLFPNTRLFYAHLLDILGSSFNTNYMSRWVAHYMKFLPGQDFTVNSGGSPVIPAALPFIQSRSDFVRSTIAGAGGNAAFAVSGTNWLTTGSNLITLGGTAPISVRTLKVNGVEYPINWTSVSAWSLRLVVSAPTNVLTITAYDLAGNLLTNFTRTVTVVYTGTPLAPQDNVVFSEIMYNPAVPDATYVELQNLSTTHAFDLSNWRLEGVDYRFPSGAMLAPRAFLVLAGNASAYASAYGSSTVPFGAFEGRLEPGGETLTLLQPGAEPSQFVVVDKVRYEPDPPWSAAANGQGAALQLIDGRVDNARVSNWADGMGWRFASATGNTTVNTTNVFLFLQTPGDVYLDDIMLVAGSVAGAGSNLLQNGDFESPLSGPWTNLGTFYTNSAIVSDVVHAGSGSLHLVGTGAGSLSQAIRQDVAITPGTYTLSYWYRGSLNGSNVTVRTYSGGPVVTANYRPTLATPGASNALQVALPPYPLLWLNEVQPNNLTGPTDRFGDRDPWVELYNNGPEPISLEDFYLADNYTTNLTQWRFPPGASIAPGQFLVVWADGEPGETTRLGRPAQDVPENRLGQDAQGTELGRDARATAGEADTPEWHTSFRLNATAGSVALVRLVADSPQIMDYLNYKGLAADQSYGDYPDGEPFERRIFNLATPRTNNYVPPVAVLINEWVADNSAGAGGHPDPADGRYNDWFELFNAGSEPADLSGFYLTDNLANRTKWRIPSGTVLPPGGFLLVWADEEVEQNGTGTNGDLHANFKLERNGEALGLFAAVGTNIVLVDALTFDYQYNNVSEGRYPDGAGARQFMATPTPRAPNVAGNTRPLLAAVDPLTVQAGQTLSFVPAVTDPEAPPQVLSFGLTAATAPGAAVDPASGRFTWTPTPAQAPSTNTFTLRVTDNGTPALSSSQSFVVYVVSGPMLVIEPLPPDGPATLNFVGMSNAAYAVEWKEGVGVGKWTKMFETPGLSSQQVVVAVDNLPRAEGRIYRVVQPPPPGPTNPTPLILTSPKNVITDLGADAEFSVFAVGTGLLRYQWLSNGLPLGGATSDTLTIPGALPVAPEDFYTFTVELRDDTPRRETSGPAFLAVRPAIFLQPEDQTAQAGETVQFSVEAFAVDSVRYRWRRNGRPLAGATNAVLVLPNVQSSDAGIYSVVVSHPSPIGYVGTFSSNAVLTVTDAP